MNIARRLWKELVRPRGQSRHRFYRGGRRSQAGVALLIVMTTLLFMTVLVTEIAYAATIRIELSARGRDEAKAEALANTGIQIYRLLLVASKAIGSNPMIAQAEQTLGINVGDRLWQMVPYINTNLMRMLFVAGDAATSADIDQLSKKGLTNDQVDQSKSETASTTKRNFLDFDGDFYASVSDEDRKINVGSFKATTYAALQTDPTALQLYGLMSGVHQCPSSSSPMDLSSSSSSSTTGSSTDQRDDLDAFFYDHNVERWDLIANLADWTDTDGDRIFRGGNEDVLYNNLATNPYLPKNAPFDTLEEVRLVDGWNQDDVWNKFGKNVTVYGSGKINLNTASCDVMWAMLKSYITPSPSDDQVYRLMDQINQYKALMSFQNGKAFAQWLSGQGVTVDPTLGNAVTTDSRVFRVTSTGKVGESTVTTVAVIDFTHSAIGQIVYWRVE